MEIKQVSLDLLQMKSKLQKKGILRKWWLYKRGPLFKFFRFQNLVLPEKSSLLIEKKSSLLIECIIPAFVLKLTCRQWGSTSWCYYEEIEQYYA